MNFWAALPTIKVTMLLINPEIYEGYRFPSLGLLYLASALKAAGHDAGYFDCNYTPRWRERLKRELEGKKYVGIYANVLSVRRAVELSAFIRKTNPAVKIIMGGPYPTVCHEDLLPDHADLVGLGEGEGIVCDLASGKDWNDIPGLVWKENGVLNKTPARPLIQDLDAMPMPAWEEGEPRKYKVSWARANPVLPVMTSRGCPYRCTFCGSEIVHRAEARYRDVERVADEIETLQTKFGAREIHVWDDNFTLLKRRAIQLCERLIERGLNKVGYAIPAGIKPDWGDIELFSVMKRAGFYSVAFAVETGDQGVMDTLGKGVKLERVRPTVEAARKAGLHVNSFFMLGLPDDTERTMKKTIDFARSLPVHQALFFMTLPFPGTAIHERAKAEGQFNYQLDNRYWENGFFKGKAAYEMPGFSKELVERMYRRAYRAFYMRPGHILRLAAARVRSPFDLLYVLIKGLRVVFAGRQF